MRACTQSNFPTVLVSKVGTSGAQGRFVHVPGKSKLLTFLFLFTGSSPPIPVLPLTLLPHHPSICNTCFLSCVNADLCTELIKQIELLSRLGRLTFLHAMLFLSHVSSYGSI